MSEAHATSCVAKEATVELNTLTLAPVFSKRRHHLGRVARKQPAATISTYSPIYKSARHRIAMATLQHSSVLSHHHRARRLTCWAACYT